MISKQYIKELEFKTIQDVYNYILDSEVNGAYKQCKELLNKLSKEQYKDFMSYINCEEYKNIQYKFIEWRD